MWNARLNEAQAGIKTAGRNINNLRYANNTTFTAESEEQLKSLLITVREESEKAGLKLNIQKMKIMASSPITSCQIYGETGNSNRFSYLGLQNYCRWWLQSWNLKCLLSGGKAMIKLDNILKSRHITLPTKFHLVKAMVFPAVMYPVVMYGGESWTSPEYSLDRLMLKLKLQYFGHLMWRTDSSEKTLMLGKIEGRRRRGQQRLEMVGWHHWLNGHEFG